MTKYQRDRQQAAATIGDNILQLQELLRKTRELAEKYDIPFTYELKDGTETEESGYDDSWTSSMVC